MVSLVWMLASCWQPPPTPPPLAPDAGTHGAMVHFNGVQGYLARPDRADREQHIEVWQTDATGEVQRQARIRAEAGVRVFVVSPSEELVDIHTYLDGLGDDALPLTACIGPCPEAPASNTTGASTSQAH